MIAFAGAAGNKQHGEEQQPTAEKHGGKAIFKLAQAVAQDADEPQEGDAGERHHVEGKSNGVQTRAQPRSLQRIRRHGKPDEHKAGHEQDRKDDAGNGGGARRLQARAG